MNPINKKTISVLLGSIAGLGTSFGFHSGWLSDPTVQNIISMFLTVALPTILAHFVPGGSTAVANAATVAANILTPEHIAQAEKAAAAAIKAAQDAAALLAQINAANAVNLPPLPARTQG